MLGPSGCQPDSVSPVGFTMPMLMPSIRARFPVFLRALLAQDCQLCAAASGPDLLCSNCLQSLPRLAATCPRCAMPMATKGMCGQCLKTPPHFDATLAALRYAFPADQLILGLKYGARLPLAILLGDLLANRLSLRLTAPDLMIPMPLHRARLAERGFNQALEISRQLARISGVPIRTDGIVRVRDTPRQADLHARQRLANVRGAFDCGVNLSGMTVAIVDDVMTTGASLNELARTLKRAGAARVENWVVARTWPGPGSKMSEHV